MGGPLDVALGLQLLQMRHHSIGRSDSEASGDLADRRSVSAGFAGFANELQNFGLPGSECRAIQ